jgi:aspartate-semialdehyde dehydrogenase
MAGRILRGAVIGASTLLGKELAQELNDSSTTTWDLTLLDAGDAGGQITSAGDEALIIQPLSAGSFEGIDVVFFAGDAATARKFWQAAHKAGASIVDLTGGLDGLPGVLVRSAWVEASAAPDLATIAVVAAHPMAAVLALIERRLQPIGLRRVAATVLQPASELGSAGVDELQQQAVGLLTFKPLQKNVYDAQMAFNMLASLGGAAKIDLERISATIARQEALLCSGTSTLAIQLLQAPVFHGYTASAFVEMSVEVSTDAIRNALQGGVLQMATDDPSNENAAGAGEVLVSVREAGAARGMTFWLWLAGDNLRLAVRNAAGCAQEIAALRPASAVN